MRPVVVTGAGGGIGASTARKFLDLGDRVYGADLAFDETPPELIEAICDVADPDAVSGLVERVVNETGRIDVLVNNAGIRVTGDVIGTTIEDWDRLMAVNLRAVFLGCKFALPHMLEPATVSRVACVGAGTIGAGWASLFLSQGLAVFACDPAHGAERPPARAGRTGLAELGSIGTGRGRRLVASEV